LYCYHSLFLFNLPIHLAIHFEESQMSLPHGSFTHRLLGCLAACLLCLTSLAHAEAPMAQTQVPGYYRMMVGQFEVTALFDGALQLDTKRLINLRQSEIKKMLARSYSGTEKMQTAVNAYLINTGQHLVLVDAGGGSLYGAQLGHVLANMKAAGVDPDQVDTIVLTHMHGDHIAGLIDSDNDAVFSNATVFVEENESSYWLSEKNEAASPAAWKRIFDAAKKTAAPYIKNGTWKTFSVGSPIVPGISTIPARGHTPGHTIVTVESNGQRLLIIGDLVHNHAVQFTLPHVAFDFDVNPKQAVETRRAVLKVLAKSKELAAGSHLPFPGMGHVRAEGANSYTWVPIEFSPLK
jgi:glyoxylase-like metal-dependent hydrolase (beta-lactamase superfamily II)